MKPFDPKNRFDLTAERARVEMVAALGPSLVTQKDAEDTQATLLGYYVALFGLALVSYGPEHKRTIEEFFAAYLPQASDQAFGISEFGQGGTA
jgi:hypothetical protein